MTNFLALYRGTSAAHAKLVAVSTDQNLISEVIEHMLAESNNREAEDSADPALELLRRSRQDALSLILQGEEAEL